MQWQMSILKNGLRILTSTRPHLETVSLGVWIKTGSAFEKEDVNGISHFFEHTCFKGTTRRNALQISEEIEDVGGQMNAYTSREFTAFYAKMLKGDTELALDMISDILQDATFPEEELQKEREVVVQEIKQSIDTPDDIIFDYLQETAFPGQPLGRTILGPAEKVRSFTADTLRGYLASNYAAENIVVCAVGNIEHETFVKMAESRWSGYKSKTDFRIEPQVYKGGFFIENATSNKRTSFWDFRVSAMSPKTIIRALSFRPCSAAECHRVCFRKSEKNAVWYTPSTALPILTRKTGCSAFMPEPEKKS